MYFLDSNVAIYAVGGEHPYRNACREILLKADRGEIELVVSVEILQEILHIYASRNETAKGIEVAERLLQTARHVWPVEEADIVRAMEIMRKHTGVGSRDAVHAAVMLNHDLTDILSADADFDRLGEIRRTDPLKF
jgi:uncharacterized protein